VHSRATARLRLIRALHDRVPSPRRAMNRVNERDQSVSVRSSVSRTSCVRSSHGCPLIRHGATVRRLPEIAFRHRLPSVWPSRQWLLWGATSSCSSGEKASR
jgi:hypothetical protein